MRCKRCGEVTLLGRICADCMRKWKAKRTAAFDQAVSEIGPLTAETHKAIQKRVQELETRGSA